MRTPFLAVLLFLTAGLGAIAAQQPAISVVSAQRSKSYGDLSREIRPRDEAADVVIVVRVTGLTRDEFRKVSQGALNLVAGDEELPASLILNGVIEGKAELKAVFVGPKAIREMRLVLGDYPPVRFTAEEMIADNLR